MSIFCDCPEFIAELRKLEKRLNETGQDDVPGSALPFRGADDLSAALAFRDAGYWLGQTLDKFEKQ